MRMPVGTPVLARSIWSKTRNQTISSDPEPRVEPVSAVSGSGVGMGQAVSLLSKGNT